MRIGTVCFATERGLGYLAKSFVDNGIITDVCVIRHGRIPTHLEWYPGCLEITDLKSPVQKKQMEVFCGDMDAILLFETAFHWGIIEACRSAGTLSILMPMYECTPDPLPLTPDKFICPSSMDMDYYPDNSTYLPVPVEIPWVSRSKARVFAHNAGYIGLKGRNGTIPLLESLKYVESDIEFLLRAQTQELYKLVSKVPEVRKDRRVHIHVGNLPYEDLRRDVDVCVAPELFNGLSLPLQEARANGQLVITTNRRSANEWLPSDGLIPVKAREQIRVSGRNRVIDRCVLDPRDIAAVIDRWYGQDISSYSLSGKEWAKTMSWEVLKPKYMEVIEGWYEDLKASNRVVR